MSKFFRSWLKANELRPIDVANDTGISYITVWQWTQNRRRIGLTHIVPIAEYMDMDIKELIEVEANEKLHH